MRIAVAETVVGGHLLMPKRERVGCQTPNDTIRKCQGSFLSNGKGPAPSVILGVCCDVVATLTGPGGPVPAPAVGQLLRLFG